MSDKQNLTQIIRKDARGCFVESLWDAFLMEKPIWSLHPMI